MSMITTIHVDDAQHLFIFRANQILTVKQDVLSPPPVEIYHKFLEYQLASDWFIEREQGYATMLLEETATEPAGCHWVFIREVFFAKHELAPLVARALALLNWRKRSRFCGKCGSQLHDSTDETARVCLSCGNVYYPSLSPAMIVLVEKDGKILLARHKHRNTDIFTCLAGYMEPGETLEECVAREVQEEAGITVKNIRYVGSKSWPFPDQLMLAFRAEWESGELVPETSEIHELHWFSRDNLPAIPLRGSVAHDLITGVMK